MTAFDEATPKRGKAAKEPLYPQLLRLRHVHPNAWQRALLGEGMAVAGGLLAMADLASAWSIVVLPLAVGGVVKAHDLMAGWLTTRPGQEVTWADTPAPGQEARDGRGRLG